MAKNPENPNLPKPDAFVDRIVTDLQNPPDAVQVSGYVGRASTDGYLRLYLTSKLGQNFVEIRHEDVLATEAIPKEQSPFGGYFLLVRADAALIYGQAPNRERARFLEGRIQQGYGAAAAAAGKGVPFGEEAKFLVSPHFYKCTWYCVQTSTGVGICATPGCTTDICASWGCSQFCYSILCHSLQCPNTAPFC